MCAPHAVLSKAGGCAAKMIRFAAVQQPSMQQHQQAGRGAQKQRRNRKAQLGPVAVCNVGQGCSKLRGGAGTRPPNMTCALANDKPRTPTNKCTDKTKCKKRGPAAQCLRGSLCKEQTAGVPAKRIIVQVPIRTDAVSLVMPCTRRFRRSTAGFGFVHLFFCSVLCGTRFRTPGVCGPALD